MLSCRKINTLKIHFTYDFFFSFCENYYELWTKIFFFYSLPNEQHCHMILMDDLVENQPTTSEGWYCLCHR